MIYYCENCGFLFCRMGEIKACPSCEVNHIRIANSEETSKLQEILEDRNKCRV
ncbi:MAG: hypothetical protein H6Q59_1944 [Firmicutes bacterium]|nr:hypothetical protein [Bacillota bacterium]